LATNFNYTQTWVHGRLQSISIEHTALDHPYAAVRVGQSQAIGLTQIEGELRVGSLKEQLRRYTRDLAVRTKDENLTHGLLHLFGDTCTVA
jgi:hypothetical protein